MAELTHLDVAALRRATTIHFSHDAGTSRMVCEGPGVPEALFHRALAFYGDDTTAAHPIEVSARVAGSLAARVALTVERADADPAWRTIVELLAAGDHLGLYWTVGNESGGELRLVASRPGQGTSRTFLIGPMNVAAATARPIDVDDIRSAPAAQPASTARAAKTEPGRRRGVTTLAVVAIGLLAAAMVGASPIAGALASLAVVRVAGWTWARRPTFVPASIATARRAIASRISGPPVAA